MFFFKKKNSRSTSSQLELVYLLLFSSESIKECSQSESRSRWVYNPLLSPVFSAPPVFSCLAQWPPLLSSLLLLFSLSLPPLVPSPPLSLSPAPFFSPLSSSPLPSSLLPFYTLFSSHCLGVIGARSPPYTQVECVSGRQAGPLASIKL